MFGNILGKKKSEVSSEDKNHAELVQKISKMKLTDMRAYINNKILNFEVDEDGLVEVLRKLTTRNSETSKRYIEIDDMDSKIKKAFDLVISIASHAKITVVAVELIQEFITLYNDIIVKFDRDNKQIYESKLKDSLDRAIGNIGEMADLKRKMNVLGE
jgi:hypothetical protein